MTALNYYQDYCKQLEAVANRRIADEQARYMKNHFVFFGVPATVWQPIAKTYHKELGLPQNEALLEVLELCYADDHREMHYFALETLEKSIKELPKDGIHTLEWLITTNSWWDSVDWLAKIVGMYFQKHPDLIVPTTERWMSSQNRWLQRVAIIFQLRYRDKTDEKLLFSYIQRIAHSKEFFLQKAAGWALRAYSRWNVAAVIAFVENNQLAPLTKREGLRLLKQNKS
jgi:3-methyladenine DNA glycosylase AlkD